MLKYTEVRSQQMAFIQSPSLSNNRNILNNYLISTVFFSSLTWAVALGSAVEREVFPTAQALHVLSIRYPLRFLLAFHPFFLLGTFCLPKWAPIPNDPTVEQHLAFQRSSKWVANAVLAAPTILPLRQRCWSAKTAQLQTSLTGNSIRNLMSQISRYMHILSCPETIEF